MATKTAPNLTKNRKKVVKNSPDGVLLAIILILVGFGIVMVYSASFYYATTRGNAPTSFAVKQFIIGGAGIIIMLGVTFKFNYRILSNKWLAGIIYAISLILSVAVMFVGREVNGATRWIDLGFIQFQPSEIAKISIVIMLSAYIVRNRKKMKKLKYIAGAWGIVFLPTFIIALENLSSAIVIFFIGVVIMFITSSQIRYYLIFGVALIGLAAGVYYLAVTTPPDKEIEVPIVKHILKSYRLDRIRVWKDPWLDPMDKGYQPIQSLYAVGSGGIFGVGLGKGIQKQGFLPEPYNDIIFAVICEELGLIGAMLLLLGYSLFVIRGLVIAVRASDYFGTLVAVGISSMVGIQVIINVAVNTNTMPTTGMQLPLVSYGGTAIAVLLATLGILLNISTSSEIQKVNQ